MKKFKWLRGLCAGLLSASLVLGFAACANDDQGGTQDDGTVPTSGTLTIWAWDDNFNVKAANVAADYYKQSNPGVTVNVVSMAQDDIVAALNTAFSAANYEGLPDIVLIEDYRIQGYLQSYQGELADLSDVTDPSKFMDYKLEVMTDADGKVYGVPFDSGVAALFYRTDYIEQAGYTQEDMKDLTWEKYIEIGKAVKEKTGHAMLTLDPSDLGQLRMMMQSVGAWYVAEDGQTVTIQNNAALKEAISIYKQMIDAGIVTQVSGWDPFVRAFQDGSVASVPTGCWIAPTISAATDQSGKWAVAPLPKMGNVSGSGHYTNIGGGAWYVIAKSDNVTLAKDFLSKTFASNNELLNQLVSDISLVSTLKSASTMQNYTAGVEFYGGQAIFQDFASWTEQIPPVNYGQFTYDIEDVMTTAVQSVLNGTDIDSALASAQTQAEGIIVA